mmetsp:Transcript_35811/g.89387  ORF Transcript_35811/g.89387 Transcript_35811/m.89387 type:complete len:204 (-) Transcript_35811:247-858(-)
MSKKNNKKRWNNQHQEQLRREKEDAEKKAERAAKKAEKDLVAAGGMLLDSITEDAPPVATKRGGATRKTRGSHALKAATLKVAAVITKPSAPVNKNTRKILKGVPVGLAQRKLKLRKGTVVRGIKITDADSKNTVLRELKAEMAMGMMLDDASGASDRLTTKQVHAKRTAGQKRLSATKVRVTGNEFQGKLVHHKVNCGPPGG